METEWGPGKEKAKGQLGNFLKRAENSREYVSHSLGSSCFLRWGLRPLHGSQAAGLACYLGALVWTLIINICSWRHSSSRGCEKGDGGWRNNA